MQAQAVRFEMKGLHRHSSNTRDAALRRLTRANRWLVAGSITLTGVLAEVAAQAFPGKKLSSAGAATVQGGATSRERHPPDAPEALHPPEQAPQASGEASSESPTTPQATPESQASQGTSPPAESAPPSSESPPPSSESAPPAEAPAQPARPESPTREEAPPVVSGAS
jgi:hypothetical protein